MKNKKMLMKEWRQQINNRTCFCILCGHLITSQNDLSTDHLIPKSKGGTTTEDNLGPAHKICNSFKGSMDLDTFETVYEALFDCDYRLLQEYQRHKKQR